MKIILDAGHGLNTPGKRTPTDSMREFHFNSEVANYTRDVLKNYECQVEFAHDPTGKVDIPLGKRTDYANRFGADVYVSIHANAFGSTWNNANGIETYVYKTNPKESRALAEYVQKKLIAKTGRSNRGVKTADFQVLRETKMTAILAECGFMTNQTEASLLKSTDYRLKCAYAIAESLIDYYKLKEKPQPKKTVEVANKGLYKVQVGAFSEKGNADRLAAELKSKGYPVVVVQA